MKRIGFFPCPIHDVIVSYPAHTFCVDLLLLLAATGQYLFIGLDNNPLNKAVFSQLNAPGVYSKLGMVDPAFV